MLIGIVHESLNDSHFLSWYCEIFLLAIVQNFKSHNIIGIVGYCAGIFIVICDNIILLFGCHNFFWYSKIDYRRPYFFYKVHSMKRFSAP